MLSPMETGVILVKSLELRVKLFFFLFFVPYIVGEEACIIVVVVGETSCHVLYHRQHKGAKDEPIFIVGRSIGDEVDREHDKREEDPSDNNNFTDVEFRHIESLRIVAVETLLVETNFPFAQEEQGNAHDDSE